jgi:copper chaperone NosL
MPLMNTDQTLDESRKSALSAKSAQLFLRFCRCAAAVFKKCPDLRPTRHKIMNTLSKTMRRTLLMGIIVLALAACQSNKLEPAALSPEDMCTNCKMAISDKQFAAQYLTNDGDAIKFDDLGCLVHFLATQPQKRADIAAFFVADYETRQWLKAEAAFYVHSEKFQTPMQGGLAAFGTPQQAEAASNAKQGRLLNWQEVLSGSK